MQTGRDISMKHLSFLSFFLSLHISPCLLLRTCLLTKIELNKENGNEANKYSFLKKNKEEKTHCLLT